MLVYPLSVEGVAKAKRDPANAVLQANQARLLALIPAARLDERQPEEISCLDHVVEWLHGLRLPRSHPKVNRCIKKIRLEDFAIRRTALEVYETLVAALVRSICRSCRFVQEQDCARANNARRSPPSIQTEYRQSTF